MTQPISSPDSDGAPVSAPIGGLGSTIVALVGSGVLVNVLLALVARSVSTAEYALFSAFWSIGLIAGFGVFLPVEQWLAGRLPASPGPNSDVRAAGRLVAWLVLAEVVVLVPVGAVVFSSLDGGTATWVALAALCAVSGVQFLVRGWLIGTGRMHLYAVVLLADVGTRVLVVLALSLGSVATAAPYAWAVVAGLAVAHLPVAVFVLAGAVRRGGPPAGESPRLARPVALLLLGSFGAQVLFNGPTIALSAAASTSQLSEVGVFQAAFQLVRIPLFLAVPMQAALVPLMGRALHDAGPRARVRLLGQFAVGAVVLIGAGALTGWGIGPWLVRLVFGAQYDASSTTVAVLAAGSGAYLGLLVLTQGLVADRRFGLVGASWGVGVLVSCVVFVTLPDALTAATVAFAAGCAAGLITALVAAARANDNARRFAVHAGEV